MADEILEVGTSVDVGALQSGMNQAAQAVTTSTDTMAAGFAKAKAAADASAEGMESSFSKTEARHAAHMLGMNRAVGGFLASLDLVGPAMAMAFAPLAIMEVAEWLSKGLKFLDDWVMKSENIKIKAAEVQAQWDSTNAQLEDELDKVSTKFVEVTQGPIAGMEFGLKHMGAEGVLAVDKIVAEMEKMKHQMKESESGWTTFWNRVENDALNSTIRIGAYVVSMGKIKLPQMNLMPTAADDFAKLEAQVNKTKASLLNTNRVLSDTDALIPLNNVLEMLGGKYGKLAQLEAAWGGKGDTAHDEEIAKVTELIRMTEYEIDTKKKEIATKQAAEAQAKANQGEGSGEARVRATEATANRIKSEEDKLAEDTFKIQEAAIKKSVDLAVAGGALRAQAEYNAIPQEIAAQDDLLAAKVNAAYKAEQALLAANAREHALLANNNTGGKNDARLIANEAQKQQIKATFNDAAINAANANQIAIAAILNNGELLQIEIVKKGEKDKVDAALQGAKLQEEATKQDFEAGIQAAKASEEEKTRIIQSNLSAHIITQTQASAAKIALLQQEENEQNRAFEAEKTGYQQAQMLLVAQMSVLQETDPQYVLLKKRYDDIASAINGVTKAQQAMIGNTNSQILAISGSIDKQSMSWSQYFNKFNNESLNSSMMFKNSFGQAINQLNSGMGNAFSQWIEHGKSFGKSMQQMGVQMLSSFVNMLVQMGMKWIESHIMMAIIGETTAQTQARAQITAAAAVAGANGVASFALAPWPVDAGAPAFGASMAAAAMGFNAFERGGLVPDTGMAMLHKNEMVLPANISQPLQSMVGGGDKGGLGGRNIAFHYAPQVSAFNADGVDSVLQEHGDRMFAFMKNKFGRGM